ncbi:MAG: hypothetical protein ACE5PT_04270 [Gemmatimonadales bacterium]
MSRSARRSQRTWLAGGAILASLIAACDLREVTVPVGEVMIAVHGVMRPDAPPGLLGRQYVIVEQTLTGEDKPGIRVLNDSDTIISGDPVTVPFGGLPAFPVSDAVVTVSNLDLPSDPCGSVVTFISDIGQVDPPTEPGPAISPGRGVYWSPPGCPTMRPGDRLALRVETADGRVVTGMTVLPGMRGASYAVGGRSGVFGAASDTTTFNRDRDTLKVAVDVIAGRLMQLEVRRDGDLSDFGTKIFADTTALTVPGDVINTFVVGDEDDVFRGGRAYAVTVAMTDTNYFDFARSDNNEFTGRGFINHLEGGIGVFGSLVASSTILRAVSDIDDPREGTYRVQGTLRDTISIDVTWNVYLRQTADTSEFSAFVTGTWLYGPIETSADGVFNGPSLMAVIVDTAMFVRTDTLRGFWLEGVPFQLEVMTSCSPQTLQSGESGPGPSGCTPAKRQAGTVTATKQ